MRRVEVRRVEVRRVEVSRVEVSKVGEEGGRDEVVCEADMML